MRGAEEAGASEKLLAQSLIEYVAVVVDQDLALGISFLLGRGH